MIEYAGRSKIVQEIKEDFNTTALHIPIFIYMRIKNAIFYG